MELAPGVIVGDHYRLDSLLGVGGMGAVWKASDLSLGRVVALKVLHADLRSDPQLNERFQREARLLASVDHPAIVPIYAWIVLEDAGRPCPGIVMPFVKGDSLADTMRKRRTIPMGESVTIIRQLLDALAAAHAAGIVHRDLKPQNVMLEDRGGSVQVRLLDFGVAKSLAPSASMPGGAATQVGMIIGTPEYMSPEQISDPTRVDARADLWAVTVTLYEMLTGNLPFPGQTPIETISRVLAGLPMPPSSFNPSLGPTLDAFFKRALSRVIEDRPRSAAEMAQQLDALVPSRGRDTGFAAATGATVASWPPHGSTPAHATGRGTMPRTAEQPVFGQPPGTPPPGFGPSPNAGTPTPGYGPAPNPNAPPGYGPNPNTPSPFAPQTPSPVAAPQFGAPSPFAQPPMPSANPYVPPPPGLPPFPPGNSLAEEREKKIVMYLIIAIASICVISIVGAALFSQC